MLPLSLYGKAFQYAKKHIFLKIKFHDFSMNKSRNSMSKGLYHSSFLLEGGGEGGWEE